VEIVIVIDSSTDDSFAIDRKHLQSNHFIPLIDNHINTGLVDRRNIGLQHCPGDKVFIPDADHFIDDDCLSAQLSILLSNPSKVACDAVVECFNEPVGLRGMCPTMHSTLRRSSMA
jgi:glycosyltransferase involved in cell wall biosynthesis